MAPTHPKTFSSRRNASSLKQATLSFRSTKRGAATSSKSKAKSKSTSRAKSETEVEVEVNDDSQNLADNIESDDEENSFMKRETLDLRDKSGKYRKYYRVAKEKMGWIPPLHPVGQTKIHEMLRVFDNSYDYGPCVGMTRLERWERAEALGLNPPAEVRDILLTEQGSNDETLVHPVFYGQVL